MQLNWSSHFFQEKSTALGGIQTHNTHSLGNSYQLSYRGSLVG